MLKRLLTLMLTTATAFGGTVTGTLQGPSGLPVKNATLAFALQQAGLIVGTGSVVPVTASCYTSTDGSVVGMPNPVTLPSVAVTYGSGTVAPGIYYLVFTFYNSAGYQTLASDELAVQLTGTGSIIISPPATFPASAAGMTVYAGTVSGQETAQGNSTGNGTFVQSATPAITSIAIPTTNNTPCTIAFNDTIIPFSGYNVSLLSSNGNAYPGWPQSWQLNGGLSGTVDISNGAPLWNGTIQYPQPILAQPLNHGPQSIAGLLNMTGYNLLNVGQLGIGTSTPNYPLDVENGYQIVNPGNGLTSAPLLTITDSSGSGATATAVVSAGAVTQVNPGSAGSGYSSSPTVTASGGVSGGSAGGGGATGNNGGRLYADV